MSVKNSGQNIVFVANSFWNLYNFRLELIHAIINDGYRVYCIANRDEYLPKIQSIDGVTAVVIEVTSRSYSLYSLIRETYSLSSALKNIDRPVVLVWTLRSIFTLSIVHRLTKGFTILANITGLGSLFLSDNRFIRIIYFMMYKAALTRVNHVFYQNNSDKEIFFKRKVYQSSSEVILGSGINLEKYYPVGRISDRPYNVVFVGRLIRDKGVLEFCDAVKAFRTHHRTCNLKFSVAGAFDSGVNAIEADNLKSLMKESQINYCGVFDDVSEFYGGIDVVVLPSYREGMSKVLIEACAHGIPVITSDVPGCREAVINNKSGFLVSPRNVSDLVLAFQRLDNLSPENLEEMGKVGRSIAEESFDVQSLINKYKIAIAKHK